MPDESFEDQLKQIMEDDQLKAAISNIINMTFLFYNGMVEKGMDEESVMELTHTFLTCIFNRNNP